MPASREVIPREAISLVQQYRAAQEMERVRRLLERPVVELGGFAGASLAFFLAAWKVPDRFDAGGTALVVTATQEEADELVEEIGAFATVAAVPFPAWESLFLADSRPDGDIFGQRLKVLQELLSAAQTPRFVVAPVQGLLQPVPTAEELRASRLGLRIGQQEDPRALAERMARLGMRSVPLVEDRGEFSLRGDILDFFPYEAAHPVRVEFFGDTVDSIRAFQAESQRSVPGGELGEVEACIPDSRGFFRDSFKTDDCLLTDYLGPRGRLVVVEPEDVRQRVEKLLAHLAEPEGEVAGRFFDRLDRVSQVRIRMLPSVDDQQGGNLEFRSVERFRGGDVTEVLEGIRGRLREERRFEIFCESPAEGRRFEEILRDHGLAGSAGIGIRVGPVRRGFEIASLSWTVLTTREIFQRHVVRRYRKKAVPGRALQGFFELQNGDLVVHLTHGIARYLGIETLERNGVEGEYLALEFRNKVKVYVPVSKIDLVQKYVGSGDRPVALDKVGGTSWARKKEQVEKALFDFASELVEIQALRQERPGFRFPAPSEWQREFEAAFSFEETPDQVEVTDAIHKDMEASRPMDRLLCGDVGYGKTELAMRATFKAVDAGKQVAVLVPTTVLAQQHYRTFRERMSGFPIRIEVLSRFRTRGEQRAVVQDLVSGSVDVVIGTHRLLSADVAFRDLGLVIIDEEQRFGVAHKERLKRLRSTVEVLTLTATPIPRTLHMAMLGLRDISSLSTAPQGRCPVRTEVIRFDPQRIREIVTRELDRDGQVYFVHNRIGDIERLVFELRRLVPEARIDHAHGQMNEHELEGKMLRFFEGEIDCLVSTTIIESGLDIPNVNTIFIDEADRYGLADLHQLRGRVGRYKHQAYCYLILPEGRAMNPDAIRRVEALVEFSDLGSGFRIATRDLEIRGAGNILGAQQSGHIAAVGYEMYCRLLARTVRKLRRDGAPEAEPVHVEIDLVLDAMVPDSYRRGESAKIDLYRRIASASSIETLDEVAREIEDRFGRYPRQVAELLDVQRLRLLCAARGVSHVGRDGGSLILKGSAAVQDLLQQSSVRSVPLDAQTVAVPIVESRGRSASHVNDELVFRTALEWMETGAFPTPRAAGLSGRGA